MRVLYQLFASNFLKHAILRRQKVVQKVDKNKAILGFWRHTGIFDNTYEYHHLKVSQPCMTII